ncbi:MAG: truB [Candidatus Taylorbacteria bacterium]|nr:truB [Candidatus Taylorbacteria bacterium]
MDQKQNRYIVNKLLGETPLEALERMRIIEGLDSSIPMTYAGRLDPMAEGVLLILMGEECKNKDSYLGLDKEYEVEVLFGFETDTGDTLGKIKNQELKNKNEIEIEEINSELQKFKGKFLQEYPAYSSKTVDGVQLHTLANKGELPEEMPTKEVEIYDIKILEEREINSEILLREIKNNISKVKGDFRQSEIIDLWEKNLIEKNIFKIIKIKVSCSSGTYMRSLAHNLGVKLGVSALAYSIKRMRVGGYSL